MHQLTSQIELTIQLASACAQHGKLMFVVDAEIEANPFT
jgi:hypothetical protein